MSVPSIPNADLAERFPGLYKLASGYVTGAWDYIHGSAEGAVQAFVDDQSAELRASAATGIEALFATYPDERSRQAVLGGWGWNYGNRPGALDALLTFAREALTVRATRRPAHSSVFALRFPALLTMAESYVSLSWDYEFGSPEAAVDSFIEDATHEERQNAAAGIDALFQECTTEMERMEILRVLTWGYHPRDGMLDEFLIWTRAVLRN